MMALVGLRQSIGLQSGIKQPLTKILIIQIYFFSGDAMNKSFQAGYRRLRQSLILLLLPTIALTQDYQVDLQIVSGGAGTMSGSLPFNGELISGNVSVIVNQPIMTTQTMSGGIYKIDLGYWSQMLRTPGTPIVKASYDIYPDQVKLEWRYDPNDPPGTEKHKIYRNYSSNPAYIYETPSGDTSYTDTELPAGHQYEYLVRGSNRIQSATTYQPLTHAGISFGKTSSNGSIGGFIKTTLNTPIPNVRVTAMNAAGSGPAWGQSVYLDGLENSVTIADADAFELFDAAVSDARTLEMWFRPEVSGLQTLISKGSQWEVGINVDGLNYVYLNMNDEPIFTTDILQSQAISINEWNHVALVRDATTLRVYINGWLATINGGDESVTVSNQIGTSASVSLGDGADHHFYRGLVDELRCWSEARDEMFMEPYSDVNNSGAFEDSSDFFTDINGDGFWGSSDSTAIKRDYDRLFDYMVEGIIAEPTLEACFHMDMGSGQTLINSVDIENNGSLMGGWSTTQAPVYPCVYTDANGGYTIKNLNFGSGRTFRVVPLKAFHEFDNPHQDVSLSIYTPANYTTHFNVVNMISISGYVTYSEVGTNGSACGEPDVEIWVDGANMGERTDADGFYMLEVEPGRTVTIVPHKGGREPGHFSPQTKTFFSVVSPQSKDFVDSKLRTIRGSVTGGACEYPVGPSGIATITLSADDGCFSLDTPVDAAGNYEFANIAPMAYSLGVGIDTDVSNIPNLLEMNTYFQNNGATIDLESSFDPIDSVWITEEDTVKFNYRSPIQLRVEGWTTNPLNDYYFEQNGADTLDVYVYEHYYGGECPMDSGIVHIKDWISDRYVDGDAEDGVAFNFAQDRDDYDIPSLRYGLIPGFPRFEGDHRKNIELMATDPSGNISTDSEAYRAVVLGQKSNQLNFATTAPEIPLLILRRPPGDGSWASFSESNTSSTSFSMSLGSADSEEGSITASLGVETEINVAPWGVGMSFDIDAQYDIESGFSTTASLQNSSTMQWTTTTSTEYTTATAVELMGDLGTVFVGGAMNLLYGSTNMLSLVEDDGEYDYLVTHPVIFMPNGFETTYIYTRGYIEDSLLPELEFLSATDSNLVRSIDRWNYILNYEDSLRWITPSDSNFSFNGGGQSMTVTHTSEGSESLVFEETLDLESSFAETMGLEVSGVGVSGTSKVTTSFHLGSSEEETWTNTTTTSYTLMDDDGNAEYGYDDYTVDVGSDPVYGTPVFRVIAGNSSCPYEEWRNEVDSVVTTPRDEPGMNWISPSTVVNVPPDDPAELWIGLSNLSSLDESRVYFLSYLSSSNTYGAQILINGEDADESAPIPFELEYLGNDSALITVSRPEGSDTYEFDGLMIKFAPECETNYAGVTQGYTASFDVRFARPCTEADIYQPVENWVVNTITGDTMTVVVQDYDLGQSYFDELFVQYSAMGSEDWFAVDTLIADTLRHYDYLYSQLKWDVGLLEDGVYDIRLMSRCLDGLLNNMMDPVRGVLDRQIPEVLGSPEPLDEVLNFNDEIALNFTESINPESVDAVNVTLYDLSMDQTITDFDLSVSEERLVINPTLQNRFIENHALMATVKGHEDLYGNPGDSTSWQFIVDRNPVAWSTSDLEHIAFQGEPEPVVLQLNNTGSTAQPFFFSGTADQNGTPLPEWLTVSPLEGSLNPGGSFDITIDVASDLNSGEYDVVIYAVTPEGYEPFVLHVVSMCPYPDWSFDFTEYEYSMNVTANVYQMSTLSDDIYDRVAAYVGDECRGWAQLEYVPELDDYQAFITVFSNEWSGEEVQFHIWDRTECSEYWQADTSVTFIEGEAYGSPMEPIALNATGELGQNIDLHSGFTWMSLNLDADDMSMASILEGIEATPGDRIIGHEAFAQYSDSSGWSGTLTSLDNYSMYQLDLENADELIHVGLPVQPDITNIEIASGWNWISYLPVENINVNHALSSLLNSTDDLIKNQSQYAQFVDGVGWLGSLNRMHPGMGYKLESFEGGMLNYPPSESITLGRSIASNDPVELPELPWTLEEMPHFQNNMTITALLESDTIGVNNPGDAVVAFAGEEVRGIARPIYIPELHAYRVFLMIQGDSGEEISLKIWDSENDVQYQATRSMNFQADAVHGTPLNPYMLARAPLGIGDKGYVPDVYSLAQNYPNPFNPTTNIGFGLPEDTEVSIQIYNLRGQLVTNLMEGPLTAGYRYIKWSGLNDNQHRLPSGVYLVVMNTESFRDVKKMVLLK